VPTQWMIMHCSIMYCTPVAVLSLVDLVPVHTPFLAHSRLI
jgi:hypothetical protein